MSNSSKIDWKKIVQAIVQAIIAALTALRCIFLCFSLRILVTMTRSISHDCRRRKRDAQQAYLLTESGKQIDDEWGGLVRFIVIHCSATQSDRDSYGGTASP